MPDEAGVRHPDIGEYDDVAAPHGCEPIGREQIGEPRAVVAGARPHDEQHALARCSGGSERGVDGGHRIVVGIESVGLVGFGDPGHRARRRCGGERGCQSERGGKREGEAAGHRATVAARAKNRNDVSVNVS
jgi:hypothetical protein